MLKSDEITVKKGDEEENVITETLPEKDSASCVENVNDIEIGRKEEEACIDGRSLKRRDLGACSSGRSKR